MTNTIRSVQNELNKILPNLVTVSTEINEEDRVTYLVGEYYSHKFNKLMRHEEILENNNKVFMMFFEQRVDYMMATAKEQIEYNGHPFFFNESKNK
tara:strand:+ start:85 stop:372 length:288 start_codon:yes stop_codon:yes gene_type:complete